MRFLSRCDTARPAIEAAQRSHARIGDCKGKDARKTLRRALSAARPSNDVCERSASPHGLPVARGSVASCNSSDGVGPPGRRGRQTGTSGSCVTCVGTLRRDTVAHSAWSKARVARSPIRWSVREAGADLRATTFSPRGPDFRVPDRLNATEKIRHAAAARGGRHRLSAPPRLERNLAEGAIDTPQIVFYCRQRATPPQRGATIWKGRS